MKYMRRFLLFALVVMVWGCSQGARSSGNDAGDGSADSDTDTDSDVDAGIDAGTDAGGDSGSGPVLDGMTCPGAIQIPDTPLNYTFTSDWSNFTGSASSFPSMSGCSGGGSDVVWLEVMVPAGAVLGMDNVASGYTVYLNVLSSCTATYCLTFAQDHLPYVNNTSSPVHVVVVVQEVFPLGSGEVSIDFTRQ